MLALRASSYFARFSGVNPAGLMAVAVSPESVAMFVIL